MQKFVTLTEFILNEEHLHPEFIGDFALLMITLENAGKIIASHVRKTGLADLLGEAGHQNTSGDDVKKLDVFANDLLVSMLQESNQVARIGSEELVEPLVTSNASAPFDIYFDPIDGSSNIDTNMVMGTIFSIYQHNKNTLPKGNQQIAAGYILYGSAVMFVFSSGHGVHGFTLDPANGCFLLSHPSMRIPKYHSQYCINEGYGDDFYPDTIKYLQTIKATKKFKLRNTGAIVAEMHRILMKGGIFLYPADKKNTHGKTRLMYEANPISWLMEQSGGMAVSDRKDPLRIVPQKVEQKIPFVFGSKKNVEEYLRITKV